MATQQATQVVNGLDPDVLQDTIEAVKQNPELGKFKVKADVDSMERLKRLAEYSPTLNTVIQGVNVDFQIEPK
jgi:hypothetical protein